MSRTPGLFLILSLFILLLTPARQAEGAWVTAYGYPSELSVFNSAGSKVGLHLSSYSSTLTVFVYRVGASTPQSLGGRLGAVVTGVSNLPCANAELGCDWQKSLDIEVAGWESGLYLAYLVGGSLSSPPADVTNRGGDGRSIYPVVPFVVKNANPSRRILLQLPTNTWHAYNNSGAFNGACLYPAPQCRNHTDIHQQSTQVSFHRPFHDDLSDEALGAITWLRDNGYSFDVAANHDLENYSFIARYKLIISIGHDEYWSFGMKQNMERFRDNGGNLIFLTSNTIFWNSRHQLSANTLISYKNYAGQDPFANATALDYDVRQVTALFSSVGNHEASLLGAYADELPGEGGYTVYRTADADLSWFWQGTGLSDGDVFGADVEAAGAKEVDSIPFSMVSGRPVPNNDRTPARNLRILGLGSSAGRLRATMTLYNAKPSLYAWGSGATVFAAGSWHWATQSLSDPTVSRITNNLVARMSAGNPVSSAGVTQYQRLELDSGAGYTGIEDAYIISWTPTTNYGAETLLRLRTNDISSSLIRIDLASVPAGARIVSAHLELTNIGTPGVGFYIDAIALKNAWREDEATWNQRQSGQAWQTAGALGANDKDGQHIIADREWLYPDTVAGKRYRFDITELAQGWVDNPASNFGLKLEGNLINREFQFASSEYDTLQRPRGAALLPSATPTPTASPTCTSTPNANGHTHFHLAPPPHHSTPTTTCTPTTCTPPPPAPHHHLHPHLATRTPTTTSGHPHRHPHPHHHPHPVGDAHAKPDRHHNPTSGPTATPDDHPTLPDTPT
ncbi:MAG: DNRLRE domain-containing protein [Caldilineales bacterium]|nr:DNRLRE domain-containing protein [Caldilineales bacterium]